LNNFNDLTGIFDKEVSVFSNASTTTNPQYITVKKLLSDIRGGKYAERINKARELKKINEDQYKAYKKKNLPAFTMSAKCNHREKGDDGNKLIYHTGLLQIDIDKIPVDDFQRIKNLIQSDRHTVFCFVSPGGDGLKAGIMIDGDHHRESFDQAERYYKEEYSIKIDTAVKDLYRPFFVSYDPELFVNPHAETFKIQVQEPPTAIQDSAILHKPKKKVLSKTTTAKRLTKYAEQAIENVKKILNESTDGTRHAARLRAGKLLGGYIAGEICDEQTALNAIESTVKSNTTLSIESAMKDVKDGIEHGKLKPITPEQKEADLEKFLSQNERTQHKTGGRTQQKTDDDKTDGGTQQENFNQDTGEIYDDGIKFKFWYEVEKEARGGKKVYILKIKYINLYKYLKSIGIMKMELDDKKRVLVRVIDNVVSEIDLAEIRNILKKYIKSLPWEISPNFKRDDLHETLTQGINQYLNDGAMDHNIDFLKIEFLTDSSDRAFFFFKNGFIEVSKDTIERKPYSQLIGYIWESQIIDHNIEVIPDNDIQKITDFPFYQFIQNICSVKEPRTLDVSRWNSLQCIIGYLLHNYKTTANKRAVIFTEENIDDEKSNGGTGKGLIMQSIGKLRKVVTIDGPAFNFDSPFAYQNVTLDTQTLFLDDVPKHFPFPRLFSAITEGLSFEGKNKPRIHLPPEKSPKIVISTNFAIKGNSESDKRRKYEMELLSYYNSKFMPVHEFGSMFFQSWNAEQWNTFYNYMMTCVQIYFENDATIPEYSSATIEERKLLISTSADFVEFAKTLKTDTPLWIDETYMSFLNFAGFSEKDKNIPTKIQLGKWIKIYCDYKKLIFGRIKYDKKDGKLTRCHYIES